MIINRIFFIKNKKYKSSKYKGFTLVELLVVIGVLGVLAAGILVLVNPAAQLEKARNSTRKKDLRTIAEALERYRAVHGKYPINNTWCGAPGAYYQSCGDEWIPGLISSGELKTLPLDPKHGKKGRCSTHSSGLEYTSYIYRSPTGIDYKLVAQCSPEGKALDPNDPFFDPKRPTYSWAVGTPNGMKNL